MQLNTRRFIALACAALLSSACSQPHSNAPAIAPLANIQPNTLLLGKSIGSSAERCIHAVKVLDADQACTQHHCGIQAFYWPVQPVKNGQRALLVAQCQATPNSSSGHLITNQGPTGDSGILIFQSSREGEGLWQNIKLPNGDHAVQLATEAAEGVLSFQQGQYVWEENPD